MSSDWENDDEAVERVVMGRLRREFWFNGLPEGDKGTEMRFRLVGREGAVELVVLTGWSMEVGKGSSRVNSLHRPVVADLGFHFRTQPPASTSTSDKVKEMEECAVLGGRRCWYVGGWSSIGETLFSGLVEHGIESLWAGLEASYRDEVSRTFR